MITETTKKSIETTYFNIKRRDIYDALVGFIVEKTDFDIEEIKKSFDDGDIDLDGFQFKVERTTEIESE
jgi:hypothetical protein